ncbi:MAG: hypothetical protein QNJ46_28720 [Leptolyngbyaceae cyanobacterium MO_188.B28]|nr:hypothetical protein [Leptolyngbyaceae cyanobacterium MO_188.B28]
MQDSTQQQGLLGFTIRSTQSTFSTGDFHPINSPSCRAYTLRCSEAVELILFSLRVGFAILPTPISVGRFPTRSVWTLGVTKGNPQLWSYRAASAIYE